MSRFERFLYEPITRRQLGENAAKITAAVAISQILPTDTYHTEEALYPEALSSYSFLVEPATDQEIEKIAGKLKQSLAEPVEVRIARRGKSIANETLTLYEAISQDGRISRTVTLQKPRKDGTYEPHPEKVVIFNHSANKAPYDLDFWHTDMEQFVDESTLLVIPVIEGSSRMFAWRHYHKDWKDRWKDVVDLDPWFRRIFPPPKVDHLTAVQPVKSETSVDIFGARVSPLLPINNQPGNFFEPTGSFIDNDPIQTLNSIHAVLRANPHLQKADWQMVGLSLGASVGMALYSVWPLFVTENRLPPLSKAGMWAPTYSLGQRALKDAYNTWDDGYIFGLSRILTGVIQDTAERLVENKAELHGQSLGWDKPPFENVDTIRNLFPEGLSMMREEMLRVSPKNIFEAAKLLGSNPQTPIRIVYGVLDRFVPPDQTLEMINYLRKENVPVEPIPYLGGHWLNSYRNSMPSFALGVGKHDKTGGWFR